MKHLFKADYYSPYIYDMNLDAWWDEGVRGLILDIDDTLTAKNDAHLQPKVLSWLKKARSKGFQIYLVSNNHHPQHIALLSRRLDLPAIAEAGKPAKKGFDWALKQMQLQPSEVVVVGDRLTTDILGANLWGYRSCYVAPLGTKHSPLKASVYFLERLISPQNPTKGKSAG